MLEKKSMDNTSRIQILKETHRLIESQIKNLKENPNFDEVKMHELKKKKLIYKDEINRLNQIQQEHDHG